MSNLYDPKYLCGTGTPLVWEVTQKIPKKAEKPKDVNLLHRAGVFIETNMLALTPDEIRYHVGVCEVGLDDVRRYGSKYFGNDGVKAINKARHSLELIKASLLFTTLPVVLQRDVNALSLGLSRVLHIH